MAIKPLPNSETDIKNLILNKLGDSSTITATEHRDVENALADAIFYTPLGDIKEVACNLQYINDNFDMIGGLGILPGRGKSGSERYGWAICNGNNGTIDKRGKVGVGYDGSTYQMGGSGGVSTVTLSSAQIPSHNHEYVDAYYSESDGHKPGGSTIGSNGGMDSDNGFYYRRRDGLGSRTLPNIGNNPLTYNNTGGGQSHDNMQPYIVTLFIQKIETPYA